jgi:hypothetical protein
MKLKLAIGILGVMVLICGCATATPIYTASGEEGFSIDCPGTGGSWGYCYEKAGEMCGTRGYEILERNTDKGASVSGDKKSIHGSTSISRNLVIRCNP